jgi:hypothetical protein
MSRNYQLGRLPACPVACPRAAAVGFRGAGAGASRRLTGAVRPRDPAGSIGDLVEGIGAPDFGLQAPGIGAAGGDLRSRCPAAARGCRPRRACRSAAAVLAAGASVPVPGAAVACGRRTEAAWAGPCQSSAGCQSTGGGSEPCLMMLAYTLSSASLSGATRPSGSSSKNRRRTSSTCPAAASC